jgi:hypothetical protein
MHAAVYSVAVWGFIISLLRLLFPENEVVLFGVFLAVAFVVGTSAYLLNTRRAKRFDCTELLAAALVACTKDRADEHVSAEVLAVVFAVASEYVAKCKAELESALALHAYAPGSATVDGAPTPADNDAEKAAGRKRCQDRLKELNFLAMTEAGCKSLLETRLLQAVLHLLPYEENRCLEIVCAFLGHENTRTQMRTEFRNLNGAQRLLDLWCYRSRPKATSAPYAAAAAASDTVAATDLFRLLRSVKDDNEHYVLVRGELKELQVRELRVLSHEHDFFILPGTTTFADCINFVVYAADARHLGSVIGMNLLASKVKHLAEEMHRHIGPGATLIVCYVTDSETEEELLPRGFPYSTDGEDHSVASEAKPKEAVNVLVVGLTDLDDPLVALTEQLQVLVNLSDQHRAVSMHHEGVDRKVSRVVSGLLTPRSLKMAVNRKSIRRASSLSRRSTLGATVVPTVPAESMSGVAPAGDPTPDRKSASANQSPSRILGKALSFSTPAARLSVKVPAS